ncbi:reverse transcriptase domain-containing protein [Tanacetum coccineum]
MPDEEKVALDAIPLAVKSPSIVDWKIHKEGKNSYYQIIRADGSSKMYLVFTHMLKSFDREDLETLYNLLKAKYGSTRPVEDLDLVLYGDLKTMFEPHVEDNVWKNQSDYKVLDWKLYDSCGVHSLRKQNVRCKICKGPHLNKDCPINEEVKQVEEHQEESARRSTEMEVWIKKLQENAETNTRNQSTLLKNLETQIEQLTKEIRSNKTLDSSSEQIKTITADQETSRLNKLHGVSLVSDPESDATEVLQHQLPRKELNPGNFALPYTIGKFIFYAMADLGASINVMPRSIFAHLHLTNLRKTNMLFEMADMSKKASLGIVENILVKTEIDVFAGKISLGINEDRISFDSMRNSHKYTNSSERIFMVRPQSPAQSNNQIDYEESGDKELAERRR